MLTILIYAVAFLTFGSELFGNYDEKMKIGDVYIHTITNTRLRVEEIVDERKGDFTAYLRPEDPTCRSMYGYMADHGRYPFPVKFVEEELEKEGGSFKRG